VEVGKYREESIEMEITGSMVIVGIEIAALLLAEGDSRNNANVRSV